MVNLNIRMDDNLYYKLVKLKGELKCKNWLEFIKKVTEIVEKELERKKNWQSIENYKKLKNEIISI